MGNNDDIAVGEREREDLPAHVEACGRRYETLRKDIRYGNVRSAAIEASVAKLHRLVLALLALAALSAVEDVAPGVKSAALATISQALAGGR